MTFYWLLFCFVVLWAGLMALQELDVLGRTQALRLGSRFVLVVLLSLFAGFFSETGSVDYENYVGMLDEDPPVTAWEVITLKDPLFQLMGFFFISADGSLSLLMFFITLVSFGIKLRIFSSRYYEDIFSLAVIFLVARFFLLHEFTQIRVSLGIALISLSILYAMENRLALVLLTIVLAAFTHLSTLALLPAVLLACRIDLKVKIYLFASLAIVALIGGLVFNLERFSRIAPYLTGEYDVVENTLFSFYFLFKLVVLTNLLLQWKSLTTALRQAFLTSVYGVLLTCVFVQNDVLSLRFGELTAVFDCLCFAYFFRHGLKLDFIYAYLGGVVVAALFFLSSMNIVNPLDVRF